MKLNKNIIKGLALSTISSSVFNNNANLEANAFFNEIDNIEVAQKTIKSGETDTWIEGLKPMPTSRTSFQSSVIDGKIYCMGGYTNNLFNPVNVVEVYDPATDTWETKENMPVAKRDFSSVVVNGKIYCIGGYTSSGVTGSVEVYDPASDTWDTKASISTNTCHLSSVVVDNKIYTVIHSYNNNIIQVYNPSTDSWSSLSSNSPFSIWGFSTVAIDRKIYVIGGRDNNSLTLSSIYEYDIDTGVWKEKTSMKYKRDSFLTTVVDGKIYCVGGYVNNFKELTYSTRKDISSHEEIEYIQSTVEVYDPTTNSWEEKSPMPVPTESLAGEYINGKIYCIGGYSEGLGVSGLVNAYVVNNVTIEDEVESAISDAEQSGNIEDIKKARALINQLPEGELKNQLQLRLNNIALNLTLQTKNSTANLDIYIKSENMLSMSLSTNSITFEDYSGIDELEQLGVIKIDINSSLPYKLNGYLLSDIQNSDGSKKIDISRLNIKDATDDNYKEFTAINDKLMLKDDCISGNDKVHNIDIKLKGGEAYESDIYKTTIKFEAEQK